MEEVEGGVEELVAGAHSEEDWARGVVQVHDGVAAGIHELVARSALKIQKDKRFFKTSQDMDAALTCMREVWRWIQWQLMSMTMLSWKKKVHDG